MQPTTRGEDEARNWIVSVLYLAQECQAIAVRQSQVEDESGVESRSKNSTCFFKGRQHVGFVARRLQSLAQKLGKLLVVFDDQQSHIPLPNSPMTSSHETIQETMQVSVGPTKRTVRLV